MPIRLQTDPSAMQVTYGDISTSANLFGKLAGNDSVTDFRDWLTQFAGWSDASLATNGGSITSPTGFVQALFETIEENAIGRAAGTMRTAPDGTVLPVFVTEDGRDLRQLTNKFLLSAITFHQAADDYLDDDVPGKGLRSSNVPGDGDATDLEHGWDEAFGYFGAALNYGDFSSEALAGGPRFIDANGDGRVNFLSEYNFGAAVNAAKRDNASAETARTNFMGDAFLAFRTGRAIISAADGELTDEQMADLRVQRDAAILAWESAIAATCVHYINDVLQDMNTFGTADYSFLDHAKHWSELKGFALGFQFNPRSPMDQGQFGTFHTSIADAPVLANASPTAISDYRASLVAARAMLGSVYGFDTANLGDESGENGW